MQTQDGLCVCGCGQKTRVPRYNDRSKGWLAGTPLMYLRGHNRGAAHPQWKGGRGRSTPAGHISVHTPDHPNAHNGRVLEHVLVAEAALGKIMPKGAVVHHIDRDPTNNISSNLVICQGHAYHNLLHKRMRALAACGNANWLRCCRCKSYDDPTQMALSKGVAYHRPCANRYRRELRVRHRLVA